MPPKMEVSTSNIGTNCVACHVYSTSYACYRDGRFRRPFNNQILFFNSSPNTWNALITDHFSHIVWSDMWLFPLTDHPFWPGISCFVLCVQAIGLLVWFCLRWRSNNLVLVLPNGQLTPLTPLETRLPRNELSPHESAPAPESVSDPSIPG